LLGLAAKVFDAIDVIFVLGKISQMADAVMAKSTDVKRIAGPAGIGADRAVGMSLAAVTNYIVIRTWPQ